MERTAKNCEVDLIYTGYWDEDHFYPESVRLKDESAVLNDPDILSDIDHEMMQERLESEIDAADYRNDLFHEVCGIIGFSPPN